MVDRLTKKLGEVWTLRANDGHGEVYLPKFAPRAWVRDGRVDRGRLTILRGAGWEIREIGDKRYLIPDEELARYALGMAYEDYRRLIGGQASAQPREVSGGEYGDLVDAILYSNAMAKKEQLSSGARLLYPESFLEVGGGSVERRVETALRGGWVMVGLITDPGDLFLLPPESVARGKNVTPEDSAIGRGVLAELRKRGLISLRGKGFGGGSVSPAGFSLPLRTTRGGEWEKMVEEQQARWGGSEIKPAVDLKTVAWLERFPDLKGWLENYRAYVEPFDLMRIKFFIDAWSGTADIDALEKMVGGIKGVLGEIAARPGIVQEYRRGGTEGRALFFAPQVLSGKDVLERSDAVIATINETTGGINIEKVWEVVTDENGKEHAREQNVASLRAYGDKGIIFRRSDGRSRTFSNITIASGEIGKVVTARDDAMEEVLGLTREALVTEMGIDLITERVRGKFSPTFEELKALMREEGGVERLIEILGGSPSEGRLVLVGRAKEGKVSGLRLVNEAEAQERGYGYFQLGFDSVEGRLQLRSASGFAALNLAAEWMGQKIGRGLDTIERSFLGGLLGTMSKVPEGQATMKTFGLHLKEHDIDRLVEVMKAVGQSLPPEGRPVLVGHLKGDKVPGLRMVSKAEAKKLGRNYFQLRFDSVEGKSELQSASGRGALDLAAEWVRQKIGRGLDTVERSFLGGLLGTHTKFRVAEERAALEKFGLHLEEHGIDRLLEVMRAVGQSPPTEGRAVLVGISKEGKVFGLRLVSEGKAEKRGRDYFQLGFDLVEGSSQLNLERTKGGRKLLDLIFPDRPRGTGRLPNDAGTIIIPFPVSGTDSPSVENRAGWLEETKGERLPATPENLVRYDLLEPATIKGRAIRYLPGEGVVGLAAVLVAPVVTQKVFKVDPLRNPGGFHATNLGALHFLNATGSAAADIVPQLGRGVSAVRVEGEVLTSPSLGRTFLRSAGQRLISVGGLAEGTVWAYPGYVAGDGFTRLATNNPTARAIGGGVGAIGVPTGLKIWLGEKGMQRLASTAAGRAAGPVGAVLLVKDVGAGMYETMERRGLDEREILLRERATHELSWLDRQVCESSGALFMSGVGIFLGLPGVVSCEGLIAEKMDAVDGGSRLQRLRPTAANLEQFQSRLMLRVSQ